jgi:hypothetical protein
MTGKTASGNGVTHALKVYLFCVPPALVAQLDRTDSHRWAFGASLIVGALLQSTIPPHRLGLKPLLLFSVVIAIAWTFLGRWLHLH